MFVKICGLSTLDAIDAAASAGADAAGFVFAPSPRRVSPGQARSLARSLPPGMLKVAVFGEIRMDVLTAVLDQLEPDWIQADAAALGTIVLPEGTGSLPVHRSGQVPAERLPRRLLFEGPRSGGGVRADWQEARRLTTSTEVVLAGGLDAGNVADAIRRVRPWGVDVSSGVESEAGRKDPVRIAAFVARARAADKQAMEETTDDR